MTVVADIKKRVTLRMAQPGDRCVKWMGQGSVFRRRSIALRGRPGGVDSTT